LNGNPDTVGGASLRQMMVNMVRFGRWNV